MYQWRIILLMVGTSLLLITISLNSFEDQTNNVIRVPTELKLQFSEYNTNYCVLYNYWQSDAVFDDRISFVVHATPDYIHYLERQLINWSGSISLALQVFWPHDPSDAFRNLRIVLAKLESLAKVKATGQVSVHLFYLKTNASEPCRTLKVAFPQLKVHGEERLLKTGETYPINVARNIARRGSKGRLFLSGDIENFFVDNYEPRMRKLARNLILKTNHPLVLVHRRFEVAQGVSLPKNKAQLKKLIESKKAVVFHAFFYRIGHSIPWLTEWLDKPEDPSDTSVQQVLEYNSARWEPQFVGDTHSVPYHDESFPFRMSSNTHLGSEMCRMGFKFGVVHDLFTVHEGIKRKESKQERTAKKDAWKQGYNATIRAFVQRLDREYPKTKSMCPPFRP